jgi:hypothetical protein
MKRHRWAVTLISRTLEELEKEGREPDKWEANDLNYALGACVTGFYSLACTAVARALTPPEERAENYVIQEQGPDLQALRIGLEFVGALSSTANERAGTGPTL